MYSVCVFSTDMRRTCGETVNSGASSDMPPGFPLNCNFRSLESELAGSSPDIPRCRTETEWASLSESQTFSFRLTQRLNMFCFELTSRCQGSVPFLVSVTVSSSTHMTLQRTHLRVTAVQGLTRASAVCVCVCHCLLDFWIISQSVFWVKKKKTLVQKRTEGNCQCHIQGQWTKEM